jgi:hypothetical protein
LREPWVEENMEGCLGEAPAVSPHATART